MKKRIDVTALTSVVGTLYPSPFDTPCRARERTRLGDSCFFFSSIRRHTRYIGDWSSDVCSSDLPPPPALRLRAHGRATSSGQPGRTSRYPCHGTGIWTFVGARASPPRPSARGRRPRRGRSEERRVGKERG